MRIDVLGEKWSIRFKKDVSFEGDKVAGLCDFTRKEILISTELCTEYTEKEVLNQISITFWHEILHAIFNESDLRDLSYWCINTEHTIIAPIAKVLAKNFPISKSISNGRKVGKGTRV